MLTISLAVLENENLIFDYRFPKHLKTELETWLMQSEKNLVLINKEQYADGIQGAHLLVHQYKWFYNTF